MTKNALMIFVMGVVGIIAALMGTALLDGAYSLYCYTTSKECASENIESFRTLAGGFLLISVFLYVFTRAVTLGVLHGMKEFYQQEKKKGNE